MENKKLIKILQHDQVVIEEILNGLLKIVVKSVCYLSIQ